MSNTNQAQRLEEIRQAILFRFPEFTPLILPLAMEEKEIPGARMATDGKKIYWSPRFVEQEDDANCATSIGHESLHNALLHVLESRLYGVIGPMPLVTSTEFQEWAKRKRLADLAADYVVNPILLAAGFDLRDRVYEQKYEGMSWKEVYEQLCQDPKAQHQAQGHGECTIMTLEGDETEQIEQVEKLKQAFAEFLTIAKARGTIPGNLLEQLAEGLKPDIPWLDLLSNLVTEASGQEDYTWKRPSRRGLAVDMYLPSGIGHSLQCLGFGSDTSGSMAQQDCAQAVATAVAAGETVRIQRFVWVEGDSKVQRVLEFEGPFEPPRDVKGRGGTDFRPIIEELLKHDPVVIIYFTDLEGTFPAKRPPVPVIWVTKNQGGSVPWGTVVRIK